MESISFEVRGVSAFLAWWFLEVESNFLGCAMPLFGAVISCSGIAVPVLLGYSLEWSQVFLQRGAALRSGAHCFLEVEPTRIDVFSSSEFSQIKLSKFSKLTSPGKFQFATGNPFKSVSGITFCWDALNFQVFESGGSPSLTKFAEGISPKLDRVTVFS